MRSTRQVAVGTLLVIAALAACARHAEDVDTASDEVTSVENTEVKSQAIGNCWLYATAGWAESLHKGATGQDIDLSEAYWNYWYWYEQISGGSITLNPATGISAKGTVTQGGGWGLGAELIRRYGYALENDFIPEHDDKAERHRAAVAAIDAALASGSLASPEARRDPRAVRDALNAAWGLSPEVVRELEAAFPVAAAGRGTMGALAERTAARSSVVHAPQELPVLSGSGRRVVDLAAVVGTLAEGKKPSSGIRVGADAWSTVQYTWDDSAIGRARHEALQKNLRDVLNKRLAVPVGWVTANIAKEGVYRGEGMTEAALRGLHESVLVDYEVDDVPGFGTLRVDEREVRPEALEATLRDGATVRFFRIKNSWGTDPVWTPEERRQSDTDDGGAPVESDAGPRPKRGYLPSKPGYNDLFVDYLDFATTRVHKSYGHVMFRVVMPSRLRFELPSMPAPPPAADAGG